MVMDGKKLCTPRCISRHDELSSGIKRRFFYLEAAEFVAQAFNCLVEINKFYF